MTRHRRNFEAPGRKPRSASGTADHVLKIRQTASERAAWERAAGDQPVSTFVRDLVAASIKPARRAPSPRRPRDPKRDKAISRIAAMLEHVHTDQLEAIAVVVDGFRSTTDTDERF